MAKQKLSPKAKRDKAKRDLAIAKTPARRKKKAENQRKRRAAKKNGKSLTGLEWDHTKGQWASVKDNRGNYGKGTRKGKKNKS